MSVAWLGSFVASLLYSYLYSGTKGVAWLWLWWGSNLGGFTRYFQPLPTVS